MISSGQYRFFSPAIDWAARDKETGEAQGATLTSGALTNHPFLEELPAISLSELSKLENRKSKSGDSSFELRVSNFQGQEMAGAHQDGFEGGIPQDGIGKGDRTGGAMKKLSFKKLSAGRRVVCDEAGAEIGEVSLAELDLDDAELDEYMAQRGARMSESDALGVGLAELIGIDRATTLGELKQSLSALKSLGAERARSSGRAALLAETIGKDGTINLDGVARLAEGGKIGFADYRAAERVATRLKEAVAAGKVLPCERAYLSRVALADAAAFEQYLAARPVALAQGAVGLAGESLSGSDRPDFELSTLARQVAAEKGISLRDALRLVANENRELAKRYRQELPRG